ncbi:hypothetical protein Vretimale_9123 [Volvox reticuliferus]|uniref:Uncharacterized protein n=1 Tax=Volvox reticuliferus TaxID=1737510 RepID=A0A8J4GCN1_9CHLO|nr:hypothetical protein Vretifemale_9825 [Volvox reticuliferus]GIM04572.1 hypothetical protein Vretimale_9123 [Volvox reticuliferus]
MESGAAGHTASSALVGSISASAIDVTTVVTGAIVAVSAVTSSEVVFLADRGTTFCDKAAWPVVVVGADGVVLTVAGPAAAAAAGDVPQASVAAAIAVSCPAAEDLFPKLTAEGATGLLGTAVAGVALAAVVVVVAVSEVTAVVGDAVIEAVAKAGPWNPRRIRGSGTDAALRSGQHPEDDCAAVRAPVGR